MSLRTAVEELIADMEKDAATCKENPSNYISHWQVTFWARMLRTALKASEGESSTQVQYSPSPAVGPYGTHPMAQVDPAILHRLNIEAAKTGIRGGQDKDMTTNPNRAEQNEEDMIAVKDGPLGGTHTTVPASMPIGYNTSVGGFVYTRRADGLYFKDGIQVTNGD